MEFEILGPLRVSVGGRVLDPGGGKQRLLLACLLVRANQVVSLDRLIDELWGDAPASGRGGGAAQLRLAAA